MKKLNETKQKGYAILFTVVLVGIISIIAIGLSNSTYKQLLLSSVARDSQVAFYEADTATECGIYADNFKGLGSIPNPWTCGGQSLTTSVDAVNNQITYLQDNNLTSSPNPCFLIIIDKSLFPTVTITGKGYNICNPNNIRTVERQLDVHYQ